MRGSLGALPGLMLATSNFACCGCCEVATPVGRVARAITTAANFASIEWRFGSICGLPLRGLGEELCIALSVTDLLGL